MKILYITNYDSMYGANQSLFHMMKLLKESYGIEPYLLVPGGGEIGELCAKEEIPCICEDFRISYLDVNTSHLGFRKMTRRIMRIFDYLKIFTKIHKKGLAFDLIHSNSSVFDIGYCLARWWKIPHIWHIREFAEKDYGLVSSLPAYMEKREYRKTDTIIAISNAIQEYVQEKKSNANIERIYNGINIPIPYQKQYYKDGVTNFCIIGSLSWKKNQLDVVKACAELMHRGIEKFRLYIVGDFSGEQAIAIEHYLQQKDSLKDKIVITGFCKDVNEFLKGMDVGIMASEAEAFGRVTVEYMANYMPVIGTNAGGTPEILGNTQEMFAPHDIQKLADLMEKYIDNRELIEHCGQEGRKRAEMFDAKTNANKIYNLYQTVIKDK